jgi:hypothetical protein
MIAGFFAVRVDQDVDVGHPHAIRGLLTLEPRLIVSLDELGGAIQIQIGVHEFSSDRVQAETGRRGRRVKRELAPQGVLQHRAQRGPTLGRILLCVFEQGIRKRNCSPHTPRITLVCIDIKG